MEPFYVTLRVEGGEYTKSVKKYHDLKIGKEFKYHSTLNQTYVFFLHK